MKIDIATADELAALAARVAILESGGAPKPVILGTGPIVTSASIPVSLPFGAGPKDWPLVASEDWRDRPVGPLDLKDLRGWENKFVHDAEFLNTEVQNYVTPAAMKRGVATNPFAIVERDGKKWCEITASKTPPAEKAAANNKPYLSGVLRRKEMTTYGYYEARFRLPLFKGVHSAFWMMNDPWLPEIDILEHLFYHGKSRYFVNTHWKDFGLDPKTGKPFEFSKRSSGGDVTLPAGTDVTVEFTAGMAWTDKLIAHFCNGVKIKETANPLKAGAVQGVHDKMHAVVNLAMGGGWPGPVDDSGFPQRMSFSDYRHYGMPDAAYRYRP